MLRTLVLMAVAGGVVGTHHAAWAQRAPVGFYRVEAPSGIRSAVGTALSADGSVLAGHVGNPVRTPMSWSHTGGMVLSQLHPEASFDRTTGASGDGSVIVGVVSQQGPFQPARWAPGGQPVLLGFVPGYASGSAENISRDGSVVVGRAYQPAAVERGEPFRWTAASGMQGLGVVPGSIDATALATTADGSVIAGTAWSSQGAGAGFRWTQDGGYELITSMTNLSFMTADGMWFGGSSFLGGGRPCRMAADGTITEFDPGQLSRSGITTGLSDDGSVAVGWIQVGGEISTFVWTESSGLMLTQAYLESRNIAVPTGLTFRTLVPRVSADGLVFSGSVRNLMGGTEAWIAVVPSPGTTLISILFLTAGRRRR